MENTNQPIEKNQSFSKKLITQFGKFFLVGIMNTLVDLIILNLETIITGVKDGSGYSVQKAISFLAAVIFSYFINKNWTFEDKSKEKEGKKFSQFVFISVIGMLINVGAATLAITYIKPLMTFITLSDQLWVNIGALCGTAAGLLWNFAGYKFWVFKK